MCVIMLTTKHDKSEKFQWSELAEGGFREMQVAIRECAKLYFLKDNEMDRSYCAQMYLITATVRIYVRLLVSASILCSS